LGELARTHGDLVRRWLGGGEGRYRTHAAFRAVAEALWSTGTFVHLPAGAEADAPLRIARTWASGETAALSRTVIVLERGASATVLEEIVSDGGGPGRLAVPLVDARLADGARLRYVRIQRFADDVWDLGFQRYVSSRDSELASFNVVVGSGKTKLGVESDITGNGATVKLYGLVAADGEQRIDINSLQRVDGRGSNSDLLYLSALYGAARAVYYGTIRVEATSSGTGSYQECRNVLMSDRAGAEPIPVLEILTNDVARCGHGATAGRLDDTELFYIMSRGLDRPAAEQLLVRGFFQRVIDRLPHAAVRARIVEALVPRIGRIAEIDEQRAA
ncbi:MAG: SufB/SufD family protein, partial [Candidatus Limnocylindria bacterium]